MQHEAFGCVGQLRFDQVAPQAHQLCVIVHQRAGAAIDITGRGAAYLKSGLFENPEGRYENALDLLGAEDFQRRPAIGEARQRRQRRPGGARGAAAVAPARGCRCGSLHFGHGGRFYSAMRSYEPPPAPGGSCSR